MAHIVILGAGVIGLQTANTLLDAGYKVTIIAKHWPGDESVEYTSPWAGAIWRTHATPEKEAEECGWNLASYRHWIEIFEKRAGEAEEMGLQQVPLTVYSDAPFLDPASPKLWYSRLVNNFTTLEPTDIHFDGPKSGHTYAGIAINPNMYLNYHLARAKQSGARIITAELPISKGFVSAVSAALGFLSDKDEESDVNNVIIVNCTGLGARALCNDSNVYPIRGHTILARITPTPPKRILLYEDSDPVTYIVPRTGTDLYLLGGTTDAHNWAPAPTPAISESILERCRLLMKGWAADGATIEAMSEQVGLRPGRKGGARIEKEEIEVETGDKRMRKVRVVHQYGHGGAGYQNSVGSATKALGLIEEFLGRTIATE